MNKWKVILEALEIDEKNYDKVSSYIEHHSKLENERFLSNVDEISTIPITLKLISMIENLDNVKFIEAPIVDIDKHKYQCGDIRISTPIDSIDEKNIDIEYKKKLEDLNINSVADFLNKDIKNNTVYIYNLYSKMDIALEDSNTVIGLHSTHRYFTIENNA